MEADLAGGDVPEDAVIGPELRLGLGPRRQRDVVGVIVVVMDDGLTQSALPLWAAMISFSRQIGLLGAFHSVSGTGLGDQLYQIFGASWAGPEPGPGGGRPPPAKADVTSSRLLPKPMFFLGKQCPGPARKTTARKGDKRV